MVANVVALPFTWEAHLLVSICSDASTQFAASKAAIIFLNFSNRDFPKLKSISTTTNFRLSVSASNQWYCSASSTTNTISVSSIRSISWSRKPTSVRFRPTPIVSLPTVSRYGNFSTPSCSLSCLISRFFRLCSSTFHRCIGFGLGYTHILSCFICVRSHFSLGCLLFHGLFLHVHLMFHSLNFHFRLF